MRSVFYSMDSWKPLEDIKQGKVSWLVFKKLMLTTIHRMDQRGLNVKMEDQVVG